MFSQTHYFHYIPNGPFLAFGMNSLAFDLALPHSKTSLGKCGKAQGWFPSQKLEFKVGPTHQFYYIPIWPFWPVLQPIWPLIWPPPILNHQGVYQGRPRSGFKGFSKKHFFLPECPPKIDLVAQCPPPKKKKNNKNNLT